MLSEIDTGSRANRGETHSFSRLRASQRLACEMVERRRQDDKHNHGDHIRTHTRSQRVNVQRVFADTSGALDQLQRDAEQSDDPARRD